MIRDRVSGWLNDVTNGSKLDVSAGRKQVEKQRPSVKRGR